LNRLFFNLDITAQLSFKFDLKAWGFPQLGYLRCVYLATVENTETFKSTKRFCLIFKNIAIKKVERYFLITACSMLSVHQNTAQWDDLWRSGSHVLVPTAALDFHSKEFGIR
jgi:hypothetical protein